MIAEYFAPLYLACTRKLWMQHLRGLAAADRMPKIPKFSSEIHKSNRKNKGNSLLQHIGYNKMVAIQIHNKYKVSTSRIEAIRFSKTYFSLCICASYKRKFNYFITCNEEKYKVVSNRDMPWSSYLNRIFSKMSPKLCNLLLMLLYLLNEIL